MKHSIKQNRYGNWAAYTSGKHVQYFFNSHLAGGNAGADDQQQQAEAWLLARNRERVVAEHGADLARLERGVNRTALSVTTTDVGFAAALVQVAEERQLPVLATPVLIGRAKRVPHIRVTVRYADVDIEVSGIGESVLLFSGQSAEGIDWLDEHLQSGPRLGSSRAVEHRFAGAIIEGAADAGLRVRVL
jgi:hypothetical protein